MGVASNKPTPNDAQPDTAEGSANSLDQDGEATMPMAM